jgi:predicted dehydrogenase
VIGVDLDEGRIGLARQLGMDVGLGSTADAEEIEQVARLTDGLGADGVIITASTPSDAVIANAFRMCRRKGRVVLVGDVGLDLDRADIYQKELDFFISTSYGPGRYDRNYEERGLDYPIGYVRWTENRNMSEYLRMVAEGRVTLEPLIGAKYPVEDAAAAYARLGTHDRPVIALLTYPPDFSSIGERVVPNPTHRSGQAGAIGVAVVGAGSFARGMHLPNIQALKADLRLEAIVSRTGHNATAAATQFGSAYSTTEVDRVLADKNVDLVVVATRHNLHADLALRALLAGKHVLVEKPMALTKSELDALVAFYAGGPAERPILMTGFNRRFSQYGVRIAELTRERSNPMVMTYRMNAGYIPLDHWVHTDEGGGRNRGEACHIYDLFTYLTGARVVDVHATAIRPMTGHYARTDNFTATLRFEDGSLATLTYTALGAETHPKEQMEVFVDGKVIALNDYRSLTATGAPNRALSTPTSQKGQRAELEALVAGIRSGTWPIPLWQQVQATEIALAVEDQIIGGD